MYVRKTKDEYTIQQYTGAQYGWEDVFSCDNRIEARQIRQDYRANQPEYPVRLRKRRVRIAPVG